MGFLRRAKLRRTKAKLIQERNSRNNALFPLLLIDMLNGGDDFSSYENQYQNALNYIDDEIERDKLGL